MKLLIVFLLATFFIACTADVQQSEVQNTEYTQNLTFLQNELTELEQKDSTLSPTHYERILADIKELESQGVDTAVISELHSKLQSLSVAPSQNQLSDSAIALMELENDIDSYLNQGHGIGYDLFDQLNERFVNIDSSRLPKEDIDRVNAKLENLKPQYAQYENNSGTNLEFKRGLLSPRGCEGTGSFKLGASPLSLNDLEKIRPMGALSIVHITPTDHQYWDTVGNNIVNDEQNIDRFKVYAPADGNIVEIGFMDKDYRVIIEHSCTFYTIFIHLDKLTDEIMNEAGLERKPGEQVWPRIPVKEGQVIGSIGTGKLDFSVVDEDVVLPGFIKPETYEGEVWKIHTADTFDYYDEPLRSQLLSKNIRTAEPLGGKIDYDVAGKLVGNWFLENTGGYRGLGNVEYWVSHLSIVYDSIDPEHVVVSVGDFGGEEAIYGVRGNSPDPAEISKSDGIVKYELVPFSHHRTSTGKAWNRAEFADDLKAVNEDEVRGVALFAVLDDDRLKAEFFPNKKASEVSGFSSAAVIYER